MFAKIWNIKRLSNIMDQNKSICLTTPKFQLNTFYSCRSVTKAESNPEPRGMLKITVPPRFSQFDANKIPTTSNI